MKILTRLNHLKQLLETSPLDTVLDEMYRLVNSEQVLFMEFDRFVRSESVNTLLYQTSSRKPPDLSVGMNA